MQRRRERIEKWRAEQALKKENSEENVAADQDLQAGASAPEKKSWTLDDDFDGEDDEDDSYNPMQEEVDDSELKLPEKKEEVDETIPIKAPPAFRNINQKSFNSQSKKSAEPSEAKKRETKEDDEDIDPLDAYMKNIQEEVKKLRRSEFKKTVDDKKVSVVVAVAKKSNTVSQKGELISVF